MNGGRPVLDCIMHKLPSTRKYYRVSLIVPDNGIPTIEYHQASSSLKKQTRKSIQFVDLLFADKKHDTNEKFAFSIYTTYKTTTFITQDESTMNEWLTKIREYHSALYPEIKKYDAIFEAHIVERGLAKTMNIKGLYRLALCKESLDLIPMIPVTAINEQQQSTFKLPTSITSTRSSHHHQYLTHYDPTSTKLPSNFHRLLHSHHHSSSLSNPLNPNTSITPHSNHLPQHLPSHQRFSKRHPLLMSKTIELVLRSIRRCGNTDSNFYIETGRHSQIGEGDLWMSFNKKATARQVHELLLATMKVASHVEDQYLYKAPRSRSGSSSENAHRSQQSRSSSVVCLSSSELTSSIVNNNNNNNDALSASSTTATTPAAVTMVPQAETINSLSASSAFNPGLIRPSSNDGPISINHLVQSAASATAAAASTLFANKKKLEQQQQDEGYLPMA